MFADTAFQIPGQLIAIIAIAGGVMVPITAIVAHTWRKMRQTELEIGLKNEMIARGMSAEEIERVIRASGPIDSSPCPTHDSISSMRS